MSLEHEQPDQTARPEALEGETDVFRRLVAALEKADVEFSHTHHHAVFTSSDAASARGHPDAALAARAAQAYRCLRRLIDAMRAVRGNARDLVVPEQRSAEFSYLARRLRYESPEALATAIEAEMTVAASLWQDVASRPRTMR